MIVDSLDPRHANRGYLDEFRSELIAVANLARAAHVGQLARDFAELFSEHSQAFGVTEANSCASVREPSLELEQVLTLSLVSYVLQGYVQACQSL